MRGHRVGGIESGAPEPSRSIPKTIESTLERWLALSRGKGAVSPAVTGPERLPPREISTASLIARVSHPAAPAKAGASVSGT